MLKNKRFYVTLGWLAAMHALILAVLSVFRAVQYAALHSMAGDTAASALPAFVRGVWFDNVTACYIAVVPVAVCLLTAACGFTPRLLRKTAAWWYAVLCAVAFIPSAANIPYFAYFFKNINSGIFEWFGYAGTTAGMVTGEKSYLLYILLYFILTAAFIWAALRLTRAAGKAVLATQRDSRRLSNTVLRLVVACAVTGLCVFGIRGRTGYNPIKISQAYYCNDPFLNQLGINPAFNLLTSALDDMRRENRELHLMPYGEAITQARASLGITGECDSLHVLRRELKPATTPAGNATAAAPKRNVVVILMESMSASLMQTFGNTQRLTPTLDSLYNHSMAFTRCYSAGIHTNHGMTAALYSFPALMFRNLMKGTVTPHRDGIATVLHQKGWHNMFFMTHEAQYDNMKAFFSTNGYDEIFSQEDYPASEVVNSFGVSDHFLFGYALDKITRQAAKKQPFMATLLTISNHPPYVVPKWFHAKTADPETQIVEYADWAVGDFLAKARKTDWYKNTVFVIMADHGKIVGKVNGELPESYNHIPLMIFGSGVPEGRVEKLATQVDVMPTLLSLLGIGCTYDGFGIDLTTTSRPMVFYSADNQIVARDDTRLYIYEPKTARSFCYETAPDGHTCEVAYGKAFEPLRQYVFSMIQTAQYILKRQQ